MFSKRYYRYSIIALILIAWLVLIDIRNRDNPRVRQVTVESKGQYHLVSFELWNPRKEKVHVVAIIQLVHVGSSADGVGAPSSTASVVKRQIGPLERIVIKERIKGYGSWRDAKVRVFVITDPAEIEKIAAREGREALKNSHSR